jgi:excisionase family DNA binding protein
MRSVSEVARELEISSERVRQLIESGSLSAVRVGGRWVIDDTAAVRHPEGRPWSEAASWGLLWFALGRRAPWLSVKQRQRVRSRLAEGLSEHAERLSSRACSRWFRAHPAALRRLGEDFRLIASGLSAAPIVGADLVSLDVTEGYVWATEMDALVDEYGLEPSSVGKANVHLRVVSELWPFNESERVAPALVVALDLLEDADARTRRAGQSLLKRALREAAR